MVASPMARTAEHRSKGLRVAAGGAHLHVEAVLLEDTGVHANVEIDVTEIVHCFAEANRLQAGGGGRSRHDQRRGPKPGCNCSRAQHKTTTAQRWADAPGLTADMIDHGSEPLGRIHGRVRERD
jgi:hypothetical protein